MPVIDFSFRGLEIFCRVVELESFSKAAESVFLVQASVNERISSLERKIGIRLLDRLGRKVVPTAAGELLYKHAVLLLEIRETATLICVSPAQKAPMALRSPPGSAPRRLSKKAKASNPTWDFPSLSARVIDTELKTGLLKALKVKELSMTRHFFLIRNRLRVASPSCHAMHDFLLSEKP